MSAGRTACLREVLLFHDSATIPKEIHEATNLCCSSNDLFICTVSGGHSRFDIPQNSSSTALTYQEGSRAIEITNILYIFAYGIPSGLISVITLVKLGIVISKHKSTVQPAQSAGIDKDQSAVYGSVLEPVKKNLKMVGLVSCSFWLTTIPGFLIRVVLFASCITWADTDQKSLYQCLHWPGQAS